MDESAPTPARPIPGALAPERPAAAYPVLAPEQRRVARLALWVLGVLGSGSLLGVAFSLYLVNHFPLLLIALSPLGRHLVLAAPAVDPAALVAVLTVRRLAFYLACFYLGRALGPMGIPWIEARAARFAVFVRWLERIFSRSSHLVVLGFAGPTVSALAGIAGMKAGIFTGLATVSLVLRGVLLVGFAAWIETYLEIARAWIDAYWLPGTVVMVLAVAVYRWRRRTPATVMED